MRPCLKRSQWDTPKSPSHWRHIYIYIYIYVLHINIYIYIYMYIPPGGGIGGAARYQSLSLGDPPDLPTKIKYPY